MKHLTHLGYSARDRQFHPRCSCGWVGKTTRWASAAMADANIHLAAVGAPKPEPVTPTWARRYLGAGRGSTKPSGGSAA